MTVKELMDKLSEVNSVTLSGGSDRVYLNVFIDD